ncbi:hypothetical protein NE237_010391 [Protea cynaroides]|uniref:Thioredoxin domain-containing protein n=1 Tax=Protea cynaroides TaxID=273540 RepID=A0A9Q0L0G4_9MAGN|nr:hypothetical protein NE237_010391 [Protea cynaroides]
MSPLHVVRFLFVLGKTRSPIDSSLPSTRPTCKPSLYYCIEIASNTWVLLHSYQEGPLLQSSMGNCVAGNSEGQTDVDPAVNFSSGNVHLITSKIGWDEKISEANKDGKLVVVNFSASWCGPCRMIAPIYSELSEKCPSLMFLTVDVDELSEFSSSWDIRATPTFFILKDGQQVEKLVGANKPELQAKIINLAESIGQNPK